MIWVRKRELEFVRFGGFGDILDFAGYGIKVGKSNYLVWLLLNLAGCRSGASAVVMDTAPFFCWLLTA